MPRILPTLEEYTTKRQETTLCMVFHTKYNDIRAFKKQEDEIWDVLTKKEFIDHQAREEFKSFMQQHYPDIELVEVFDNMPLSLLLYPYLGSIAINAPRHSEVANTLINRYEDSEGVPLSNRAVLWEMDYETAKELHQKRDKAIDEEFGEG